MRTTAPERPAVPGPSSSPGRRPAWREQRGQTASDYLGILLIVSFIVAALFASGVGTTIADRVEVLICQIGGGTNCEQADGNAALEPCLISSSEGKSNFKVFVGVVEIGKESVLIREDFSDGRSRFTLVDSSELKGELFAGAKAKIGKFGISAAAEAAAGGRLKGAQVFEVPTDKADEFEESVAAAGSFEGILRDAAELNDTLPFGIPNPLGGFDDFALDVLGIDKDDPITDPTEEYIDVSAIIGANGTAGVGGGVADAEVAGMVEGAAGAKVIHEGKRAGEVELYYQLKGELGGSLSAGLYGVNLGGESTFVATMTLGQGRQPEDAQDHRRGRLHRRARARRRHRGQGRRAAARGAREALAQRDRGRGQGDRGRRRARPERSGQPRGRDAAADAEPDVAGRPPSRR